MMSLCLNNAKRENSMLFRVGYPFFEQKSIFARKVYCIIRKFKLKKTKISITYFYVLVLIYIFMRKELNKLYF